MIHGKFPQNYHPTHFSYNFHPSSPKKKRVTSILLKASVLLLQEKIEKSWRKKSFGRKKKKKHPIFPHHRASNALVWVKFGVHSIYLGGWTLSQGAVGGWFRRWNFGRMGHGVSIQDGGFSGKNFMVPMVGWECRNVFKGSRVVSRPLPWKWLINGWLGDPHHTWSKSSRMIFPSGFANHGMPPLVFFRAASQFLGF